METKYKRVLLKISGEALAGDKKFGIDEPTLRFICENVKSVVDVGVQVAIVVGGGNFWRGRSSGEMERTRADHIGMLGTVMNSLAVADALENQGLEVRVQTALTMTQIAEPYIRNKATSHLNKGRVIILACGTGNPFFSTDSAAVLRGLEINADIVMKATMVDGVYDKDPKVHSDAVKYDTLTMRQVIEDRLGVIDTTAATLCQDNGLELMVLDIMGDGNLKKAVLGENVGTLITV